MRFLVIGGQKCATTTLFHHLAAHPDVYMAPQKELNFFAKPELYARGMDWYRGHFAAAPAGALCGEASPLYLSFGSAPARIRAELPDVKLVALLRNPIDRAHSHYRMAVRRGLEPRGFDVCVRQQAAAGEPPLDPADPERDYLFFGAYGRAIDGYLRHFPRRALHVEFTEDLAQDPLGVLRRVATFIGARPGWEFPEAGRVFHSGGAARYPRWLARGIKRGLKALGPVVGAQRARAAAFWFETEASVRPRADAGPPPEVRALLADHYRKDVALLERHLGVPVPWREFR
ncbi:MAG: sulfotransferase family protein [Myxococcota bacterium]